MKPSVEKRLREALIACEAIETFTKGRSTSEYFSNDMVQPATVRKLEIIGEALDKAHADDPNLR